MRNTDVGNIVRTMTLQDYKKAKIKMLKNEFKFKISNEEQNHINQLEDELAIERYCRKLYRKYLFSDE